MARFPLLTSTLLLLISSTLFAADEQKVEVKDEPTEKKTKPEDIEFLHKHPTLVKMWVHSNKLRKEYGLAEQGLSPELTKAAQDHAWFMAKTHQFSHYTNGGYVARVQRHKYPGSPSGEIILYGTKNIPSAFTAWLNSPPHAAILLGGSKEVGYGYAIAANGTTYWVGVYGMPKTKVIKQEKN